MTRGNKGNARGKTSGPNEYRGKFPVNVYHSERNMFKALADNDDDDEAMQASSDAGKPFVPNLLELETSSSGWKISGNERKRNTKSKTDDKFKPHKDFIADGRKQIDYCFEKSIDPNISLSDRNAFKTNQHTWQEYIDNYELELYDRIMVEKNPENNLTIDLHGQSLRSAKSIVQSALNYFTRLPCVSSLSFVTGVGKHSSKGSKGDPVIKNFVLNLFKDKKIAYVEENAGGKITIKPNNSLILKFEKRQAPTVYDFKVGRDKKPRDLSSED